jgi:photosystem II stability/assembly factor-like uncharacterized protein
MGLGWRSAPVALRALPFVLGSLLLASCSHVGERDADGAMVSLDRPDSSVAVYPPRSIGTRDRPNARAEWFYGQRAYPQAKVPDGARAKALRQASKIPEVAKRAIGADAKASADSLWTAVGPLGFTSNVAPSWGQMSGRVRSMAIDPTNADRLLLGVSTGGVWLSNDAGVNWTPLTDDQPSLAIGAVAFAPSDPQIIYAGTGEGNGSYYSVGILKSTDGGASWNVLGADVFNRAAISGLLVDPTNPDVVVLCATQGSLGSRGGSLVENSIGGIYRSTDGGQTYTVTANNFCRGLYAVPDSFNVMYHSATGVGAANGLYRSDDAGQSWTLVSGAVNGEDVQRLAIGLSRDGSRIYIGGQKGGDVVIQRSSDGGQSWTDPTLTPVPDGNESAPGNPLTYCESQCDYDNVIAVNPFNPDDVYFGGIGLYRSTDGGASFSRVGENNEPAAPGPGPLHVDHHALVYHPTVQGLLFNGNDGGIYRTTDGGANWNSLSGTLGTLQHYHISLHPTDPNIMFTGNQDNGTTRRTTSSTWLEVAGGDGAFSAVDASNPQVVFASTTNLNILKSTNGGDSFAPAGFEREQGEPADFIAPFVIDPSNSQVLYAGTNRLWRTNDSAANWAPVSPPLVGAEGATLSYIAVAPSDASVVYTVASDGSVGRLSAAGGAIVSAAPLPGRYATGVAVGPTDANTVYVTYSGFNSATPDTPGHVFRSTDGGASWTNVSDNLADAPANAVAIRPDQPNEIYVGTDVGVFVSFNGGGGWQRMGNGIPNAIIGSLAVNGTTGILAAATYGRSVYTTQLGAAAPGGTTNYSYTYWNPNEAGWGFNAQHQGNLLYGTWYSYDPETGAPMFLTVEANQTSEGNFAGPVYRVAGTPFEQINNAPAFTAVNQVGTAQLAFGGNGALSLSYSLFGVEQTRQLERFTFVATPPTCTGTTASRTGASNYSDLWWNAAEPGWGLTLAHQGNTIFVLWYTYGEGGVDQWFSGSALTLQEDGSFAGALQRPNSGTPLPQINGPATSFPVPEVGQASLRFSDGETGSFSYQIGEVSQTKPIQRFVVVAADQPKPVCQ